MRHRVTLLGMAHVFFGAISAAILLAPRYEALSTHDMLSAASVLVAVLGVVVILCGRLSESPAFHAELRPSFLFAALAYVALECAVLGGVLFSTGDDSGEAVFLLVLAGFFVYAGILLAWALKTVQDQAERNTEHPSDAR